MNWNRKTFAIQAQEAETTLQDDTASDLKCAKEILTMTRGPGWKHIRKMLDRTAAIDMERVKAVDCPDNERRYLCGGLSRMDVILRYVAGAEKVVREEHGQKSP